MLRIVFAVAAVLVLAVVAVLQWPREVTPEFVEIGRLEVDGNAEIVKASENGEILVHTNAKRQSIDVIDLSDPLNPAALGSVGVPGEPTSVDISPDGRWALATVYAHPAKKGAAPTDTRWPGVLGVIDLIDPGAPEMVSVIGIDNHPDSIALTSDGSSLVAVIAIENEPVRVADGIVLDEDELDKGTDISSPGAIQIVTLDPATPRNWSVTTLETSAELLGTAHLLYPEDPQPEFVAISPGRQIAAVSLQENNGIVIVDLATPEITGVFSLGRVNERLADLQDDGTVSFADSYPASVETTGTTGMRTPDAITFTPDGQFLISADEGEAIMTGGRGFSIWSLNGQLVWEDGGEIEQRAAAAELYPDNRSEKKGIEIEGVAAGRFGSRDLAFAVSERGSFMVIYDITNPTQPEFLQLLPTGAEPEGIVAIPSRNLIVVAAEEAGILTVFRYEPRTESSGILDRFRN